MTDLAVVADKVSAILSEGDLSRFNAKERNEYYVRLCTETGLNPMLTPFRYLKLSGQLRLYANKSCAEQLRNIHGISIRIVDQREDNGLWLVTVEATDKRGRTDSDVGFAQIKGKQGENRGNAILKAVTKAKRRVTLSMTGLGGLMDETEVESVAEVVGQPFEIGDGEGYVAGPAQELLEHIEKIGTLSSMAEWAYDNGPLILSLDQDSKVSVMRAICARVSSWDCGVPEAKMWVRQADLEEWTEFGPLHGAPPQVTERDEDVF